MKQILRDTSITALLIAAWTIALNYPIS